MATTEAVPPNLMRRHLSVVHPSRPAVLVERTAEGVLRLPSIDEPDGDPRQMGAMAEHLGKELALASLGEIGYVWTEPAQATGGVVSEYLMLCEFREPPVDSALERFEWCSSSEAVALLPELAEALDELFRWLTGAEAPGVDSPFDMLPPHCLPGATAALGEALRGARGAQVEADEAATTGGGLAGLEQLQAWVLSSVWLGGSTVVKVTTPLWPHEPAVTELLHTLAPDCVPPVLVRGQLTVDRAARTAPWMVSRRYRPVTPEGEPNSAAVFGALARLQASAVTREQELLQAGAPERGPLTVAGDLEVLWEEAALAGLAAPEVAQLPRLEAWLVRRLRALAAVAPLLLTHGDLHPGNALVTYVTYDTYDAVQEPRSGVPQPGNDPLAGESALKPRTVIFDWTDAALAWPGVDILTMARDGLSRAQTPSDLLVVKTEYLEAAREAFSHPAHAQLLKSIEASVDEGSDLALVYHAVSYAHILRSVPERQKPFVGARFLLRSVRQLLEQWKEATGA